MDGRKRKPSPLPASFLDASLSNHHQATAVAANLSPLSSDTPIICSPTPVVNYNIDDDLWAENADPSTGSVFFMEARDSSRSSVVPSSSSSSLSSNLSITDFVPPSPTVTYLGTQQCSQERFHRSVPLQLDSHYHHQTHQEKKGLSSVQKKLHNIRVKFGKKHQHLQTTSMLDLNQPHRQQTFASSVHSSADLLQIPQGSQFGSLGTSLNVNPSIDKFKVDLDITHLQKQPRSRSGGAMDSTFCSLERLGIVPARLLSKEKFGSLLSLQFSFRQKHGQYPHPLHQRHLSPTSPSAVSTPQPVVVKGMRLGCPAAGTSLKPGDTILSINGYHVDMESIDSVLATLSSCKTLQFLVKKGHAHSPLHYSSATSSSSSAAIRSLPQTPSHVGLVRLVAGGRGEGGTLIPQSLRKFHRHPHLLLYITLDTNEDDPPEKDILFRYPPQHSEHKGRGEDGIHDHNNDDGKDLEERLLRLRGVFLTLSDSLATITGSLSHTNSTIMLAGRLFYVSFSQHGKEMLLLALPAELISQYQLQLLLESMENMMRLLHGSVHNALTTSNYCSSLAHLLGLMLDKILSENASPLGPSTPLLGVPATPYLKLPTDITMKLHAMLSGLEAADHTNRPEILYLKRPFLLVGSCLLHRGAIACSHLCPSDLREVTLFLHAYRLLELTASESISQIVIWKEVFLSSVLNSEMGMVEVVYSSMSQDRRVFLLVVGLEQMLLCMLMQGSTQPPSGHAHSMHMPSVDAVYIDRGRALLMELRAQDLLSCDFEAMSSLPSLQSADLALFSLSTHLTRQLQSLQRSSSVTVRERELSDPPSILLSQEEKFVRSSDNHELGVSSSSLPRRTHSMLHLKRPFRQRKVKATQRWMTLSSSTSSSGALQQAVRMTGTPHLTNSLIPGLENLLLHYICLESGRGLMICPFHTTPGNVHSELLLCFQCTCSSMREVLRGRVLGCVLKEEDDEDNDDDSKGWESEGEIVKGSPVSSSPFAPQDSSVVEHGVLLECYAAQTFKAKASLQYWVIGRYFSEADRELYICCQDSTPQNMIEMAFKLLFGWPG